VQENLHMELFLRVPNSAAYLRASVLWLTFVGAVIATRERGHIGLSLAEMVAKGNLRRWLHFFAYAVAAAVASLLAFASYQVAVLDKGQGTPLFVFMPVWVEECVMPAALTIVALLFVWQSGGAGEEPGKRREAMFLRLVALLAIPFAFWLLPPAPPPHWLANLGYGPCPWTASLAWPLVIVILAATMSGAPVFVAMTGIAIIFFFREGTPIHAVTDEVFGLLGSPTLPAIPLLTGAGYLLAESKAGTRLVRVLRALLGSFRGRWVRCYWRRYWPTGSSTAPGAGATGATSSRPSGRECWEWRRWSWRWWPCFGIRSMSIPCWPRGSRQWRN